MNVTPDARRVAGALGGTLAPTRPSVAGLVRGIGERVVEQAEIAAGDTVLDVAGGPGDAAVPAAVRGARVMAISHTPELFAAGRRYAAEHGAEVRWAIADAESLSWPEGSYDHVISSIGVQFIPRHDLVAGELVRVCRPGGQITLATWTPDGYIGRVWTALSAFLPSPQPGSPPTGWGRIDHVEQLFTAHPVDLHFDRETVLLEAASPEAFIDFFTACYQPLRQARRSLDPEREWPSLREALVALSAESSLDGDAGFQVASDYLLISARKHR